MNGSHILNRTAKRQQAYEFTHVFDASHDNERCFQHIGVPLLREVLRGYSSILMTYGQTGSGKTFSVLGKIDRFHQNHNVKGLLTLSLEHLMQQANVAYIELSAIETFGHHIQKIRLFDLGDPQNQVQEWDKKEAMKTSQRVKSAHKIRLNAHNIQQTIQMLHGSSHFAPTGKNPQSSRGHICYVTTVHLKYFIDDEVNNINATLPASQDLIAHWIVVDLAGSEGESAITEEFQQTADFSEIMARRLETGVINHGLSQLQIIFNELRGLKKKSSANGTGLRKTLSEFISCRSFIAVLFTISPSQDNSKSTEATLRFAESAALVKCSPIKAEKRVNKDMLISELKQFIEDQTNILDDKNSRIQELEQQVLDAYLVEQERMKDDDHSNYNTPLPTINQKVEKQRKKHVAKNDSLNHSLDFEATITPIAFDTHLAASNINGHSHSVHRLLPNGSSGGSGGGVLLLNGTSSSSQLQMHTQSHNRALSTGTLLLPQQLANRLEQFEASMNEETQREQRWHATKAQCVSHEEEEYLEQSMKEAMTDVRRASRVSADLQIVSQILASTVADHLPATNSLMLNEELSLLKNGNIFRNASITSLRSYKNDPKINTIIESDRDQDEYDDDGYLDDDSTHRGQPETSYKVSKILGEYHNGFQVHSSSLRNLSKSELMYLCATFAAKDETDKIIQSHEEQIKFLSKELNRLQKYHSNSHSFSMQSVDNLQLNMIMDDDMEEKDIFHYHPDAAADSSRRKKHHSSREASPSSSRIDPMASTQRENAPLVHGNKAKQRNICMKSVSNDEDDEKVSEKSYKNSCAGQCVIL